MDEFLNKKYLLANSENLEDYFIYIGLGYIARKVALTLKQTVQLTRNEDNTYSFNFVSPLACSTIVFECGVEFEELRPDGVKVKSVITIEGNTMTHKQIDSDGRESTHVREFHADSMTTTTTAEGLSKTVKRYYVAE
ncbi:putative fatty acid-binding protein [Anticarsia gemmatalis]|uniref:putative fatty acid-binding protein n=1 Tax=Anticarsia gemmatalis TaxID=129554 RepID=UPI003F76D0E3